jgi:hypothetical protein
MAGSNLGIGFGERGLSLFPSRPIAGTTARTYTYDLVADFGAAPGNIAATTAALQAFHAEAQRRTRPPEGPYAGYPGHYADADKDHMIILNIPAGTFPYTYNKFTRGIRKLKLIGAGSGSTSLQCTNSTSYFDCLPHWGGWEYFGEAFNEDSEEYDASFLNHGYFINTVSAGATQVTLKNNPSKASKFFPGRWVLIFSYSQQQYGFPMNSRYHDWAICTSVNPSTGVITFDRPLNSAHRDDRPYWGTNLEEQNRTSFLTHGAVGPARIAHIDHPDKPVAVDAEYRGFAVLSNPNYGSVPGAPTPENLHYVWRCRGIDVLCDDLAITNAMEHTHCKRLEIRNSSWHRDESDKTIDECIYVDCDCDISEHHSGQRIVHIQGGRIGTISPHCLSLLLENCTVDRMASGVDWDHGVELIGANGTVNIVTCDGVTFQGAGNTNAFPITNEATEQGSGAMTIGTGAAALTLPGGNGTSRIRVNKGGHFYSGEFARVVDNWCEGHSVEKNGVRVPGASVLLITGDSNHVYVDFDGVTFNSGDRVKVFRVQQVVIRNCIGETCGMDWGSPPTYITNTVPQVTWNSNQGN